jgi:hypothetical protein
MPSVEAAIAADGVALQPRPGAADSSTAALARAAARSAEVEPAAAFEPAPLQAEDAQLGEPAPQQLHGGSAPDLTLHAAVPADAAAGAAAAAVEPHGDGFFTRDTWAPDSAASACAQCDKTFSFRVRRQHCRRCGQVFCGKCTKGRAVIPGSGTEQGHRVCDRCHEGIASARRAEAERVAEVPPPDPPL